MTEDRNIIDLRDRVPDLDSSHFEKAVRITKADVYRFGSIRADPVIEGALADGIELPALADALAKAQRMRKCSHREHNVVDPDTRLLTCKDCGVPWDPLDLLLEIAAGDLQSYRSLVDRPKLQAEIRALTAQRDDLLRRVKNEKAKLQRARKSKEDAQRLTDLDLYELARHRERDDYALKHRSLGRDKVTQEQREEYGRLARIVEKFAEKRAREADEQ